LFFCYTFVQILHARAGTMEEKADLQNYRLTHTDAGFQVIKKSKTLTNPSRHFHSYWELMYIFSGKRKFFLSDRVFNVTSGALICISPYTLHRAFNISEENCKLFNIYFDDLDDPYYKSVLPLVEKCAPYVVIPLALREKIEAMFETCGKELLEGGFASKIMARAMLSQILVLAARESILASENPLSHPIIISSEMNEKISSVLDYLNVHFAEITTTLEATAEHFGLTKSHLSRTFKSETHFSFVEYVNNLRIRKSLELLKMSDKSVLEISEECGFGSQTQFGRVFKEIVGTSALQYRKKFFF